MLVKKLSRRKVTYVNKGNVTSTKLYIYRKKLALCYFFFYIVRFSFLWLLIQF